MKDEIEVLQEQLSKLTMQVLADKQEYLTETKMLSARVAGLELAIALTGAALAHDGPTLERLQKHLVAGYTNAEFTISPAAALSIKRIFEIVIESVPQRDSLTNHLLAQSIQFADAGEDSKKALHAWQRQASADELAQDLLDTLLQTMRPNEPDPDAR